MVFPIRAGVVDDGGEGAIRFSQFGFWVGCVVEIVDFVGGVGRWMMVEKGVDGRGEVM